MKKSLLPIAALLLTLLLAACSVETPPTVGTPSLATPAAEVPVGPALSTPAGPAPAAPTATTEASGPVAPAPTTAATNPTAPTTSGEALPAAAGRIAYMGPVGTEGALRAFLVNADGSGLTPVAESLSVSYYPSLSPDNSVVLITGPTEAGDADIFAVEMASGTLTNLTERAGSDLQPVWSPDGSQIAFISEREGGNLDLWVMGADGSAPRRVAQTPGREQLGSWSPDGSTIAVSMQDEIGESIWLVDVASGATTRLTEAAPGGQDSAPAWSPDGTRIAFHSTSATDTLPRLYTIAADGTGRQAVTDGSAATVVPTWSPDGAYLLYTVTNGQDRYDLTAVELATNRTSVVANAQGIAASWRAAAEPLPETGYSQGPRMAGVEIDPAVLADAYRKGDPAAPVKIVEFSDYQCPFCQRFFTETMPQLEPLIQGGTVELIFVDFPLSIHPQAPAAAEAAHCAGDQAGADGYWTMHDALFSDLQRWSVPAPAPIFAELATAAGLDGAALQTCVESGTHTARVNAGLAEGVRLGVSGTPTFFVNGDRVVGAVPFSSFQPYLP